MPPAATEFLFATSLRTKRSKDARLSILCDKEFVKVMNMRWQVAARVCSNKECST